MTLVGRFYEVVREYVHYQLEVLRHPVTRQEVSEYRTEMQKDQRQRLAAVAEEQDVPLHTLGDTHEDVKRRITERRGMLLRCLWIGRDIGSAIRYVVPTMWSYLTGNYLEGRQLQWYFFALPVLWSVYFTFRYETGMRDNAIVLFLAALVCAAAQMFAQAAVLGNPQNDQKILLLLAQILYSVVVFFLTHVSIVVDRGYVGVITQHHHLPRYEVVVYNDSQLIPKDRYLKTTFYPPTVEIEAIHYVDIGGVLQRVTFSARAVLIPQRVLDLHRYSGGLPEERLKLTALFTKETEKRLKALEQNPERIKLFGIIDRFGDSVLAPETPELKKAAINRLIQKPLHVIHGIAYTTNAAGAWVGAYLHKVITSGPHPRPVLVLE